MKAVYVTPKPANYWTSGFGLFNKAKKKRAKLPRPRNGTLRSHLLRNKKKEAEKVFCRKKVKEDIF